MGEEKKLMLIINPAAGSSGYKYNFPEALLYLSTSGYIPSVYFTAARGDATRFAAEHAPEYDVIACMGGDGTLSEMISGLMQINDPEKRPPVGYFPMGTSNDVATTLGLPKNDPFAAAKKLVAGRPHRYDVGGFGDEGYFTYIAAFGAFTEVSYATPQIQKKALGHLAYVLQGMALLPNIESYRTRVEFDDGVIEADLVYGSLSNSTSVAGIVRLSDEMVSLGDGMSELVLVKNPENILDLSAIADSLISRRFDSDKLIILHTKKARFTFEKPVAWTRDGEAGGEHRTLELCNYKAPIKMIF